MSLEELRIMKWSVCEKNFIQKVKLDEDRIKSLVKMAEKDFKRAKKEKDIAYSIERYYEAIKKLATSILLKNGLKSRNHQCLFSYLYKNNPEKEFECKLILQLAYFRNKISYYGEEPPKDFLKENKKEIEEIINWLFNSIK